MEKKVNILFQPWKKLKRLQDEKLSFFIRRYLYPFSPYYRKLLDKHKIKPSQIKRVADLGPIPFTTKKDLINLQKSRNPEERLSILLKPSEELIKKYLPKKEALKFLLSSILKGKQHLKENLEKEFRPIFLTATAGTTSQPIPFLYASYDMDNLKIYGKRIIDVMGMKKDERTLNVFPFAPHLAFWQTVFAGLASNVFMISTGGGRTVGTKGNIRTIVKVKPKFLIGTPSYVYHILKTAKERNLKLEFLNRIVLGAARLPQGFKRKMADLLGSMGAKDVNVIGTYGFTESRCAWVECPTDIGVSSGYHTYPDREVFEVIDSETGQVLPEGQDGELVYTGIDARGTALLRYRTGDLVKGGIVYSPCPHCGRTVPRVSSDIVRASNVKSIQLTKIKGTVVNLNNIEYCLDNDPEIDDWQIEISKKDDDPFEIDQLSLYVCLLKEAKEDTFKERINQQMLSQQEVTFNKVVFLNNKELETRIEIEEAVKAKKIVDRRVKN